MQTVSLHKNVEFATTTEALNEGTCFLKRNHVLDLHICLGIGYHELCLCAWRKHNKETYLTVQPPHLTTLTVLGWIKQIVLQSRW